VDGGKVVEEGGEGVGRVNVDVHAIISIKLSIYGINGASRSTRHSGILYRECIFVR